MYCTHCGAALATGGKFCANCGRAVSAETAAAGAPAGTPQPDLPGTHHGVARKALLAIVGVMAVAALIGAWMHPQWRHRLLSLVHGGAGAEEGAWPGLPASVVEPQRSALEQAIKREEQQAGQATGPAVDRPKTGVSALAPMSADRDQAQARAQELARLLEQARTLIDQTGGDSKALLSDAEQLRQQALASLQHGDVADAITGLDSASASAKAAVVGFIDDVSEKYRLIAQQRMASNDMDMAQAAIDKAKSLQDQRAAYQ